MPSQFKGLIINNAWIDRNETVYMYVLLAKYLLFYHLAHVMILLFSGFTEEKSEQISTHVKCIIRRGCSCLNISNGFFDKNHKIPKYPTERASCFLMKQINTF